MAAKAEAVTDIHEKCIEFRTLRSQLERQQTDLKRELEDLEQQARSLRRQLAGGDRSAAPALDHLDKRIVDARRLEDGVAQRISEAEASYIVLKREEDEILGARERERQRQDLKDRCARGTASVDRFYSLCRDLSLALTDVCSRQKELIDFGQEGAQAAERLIADRMFNPMHQLGNVEKWTPPPPYIVGDVGPRFVQIRALVPPGWNPALNGSNGNGNLKR
jgi:chromosome segregation ATPase